MISIEPLDGQLSGQSSSSETFSDSVMAAKLLILLTAPIEVSSFVQLICKRRSQLIFEVYQNAYTSMKSAIFVASVIIFTSATPVNPGLAVVLNLTAKITTSKARQAHIKSSTRFNHLCIIKSK